MKIMIVDDERDIESLFRQKFRKELRDGLLEFQYCYSAENAIEYLDSKLSADLVIILSDINMPGMNGIELLKIIKEKYSHLKVFMITAYDDDLNYQKAIQSGADNYLAKPIDFEVLRKIIVNYVDSASSPRMRGSI
jgi:YesN/AraC family two-component response regulator